MWTKEPTSNVENANSTVRYHYPLPEWLKWKRMEHKCWQGCWEQLEFPICLKKLEETKNPKLMTTILTETDEDYQGDEFSNKLYVRTYSLLTLC